ncbi:hypothetical protein PLICRDRAFT_234074 [Plicaturopsis crispa FD-325 SS-3]|nr:hypothetical protein PLICRDRAFT_234074 [Plicaturopsis crispa FD-325 SS-3]
MDPEEQSRGLLAPTAEALASIKVFPLIPHLKKDIIDTIDSALSWEQLTASDINFAIVRPLVFKYAKLKNMAVVYAALVVRSYFLSEAEEDLAYAGVMLSRAMFCEILAMKLLGNFASDKIQLVAVLTTTWNPLAGAPPDIVVDVKNLLGGKEDDMNDPQSALEMAITTQAKELLASTVVQTVVNDIYAGRVVFSVAGNRSMLADNYKPRAIEIYDSRRAPFLDHYRLRVPKYGAILEFLNFALLLMTFLLCLSGHNTHHITPWEGVFIVFGAAFTLEEYTASKEHGWIIYIANMWNVFDSSFIVIYIAYLVLRIRGLVHGDPAASDLGFDILSCGACILFPRLAFFAISHNVVVLALRAMIAEFVFFIGVAAVCFSGLLFTLWTLADGAWSVKRIAWLMTQIWFGNTSMSFGQASSFHPVFGPILMTMFAALSNTLLLTILISILSNTVARIDANANNEHLFQFTISTIEGVKSDALFSYQPPFNLLAFILLKPASWVLSPRALHSANVFLIKLTSFPILVIIGVYERHLAAGQKLRTSGVSAAHSLYNSLPRSIKEMPLLEALVGSHSNDLYEAIFDVEISQDFDLFEDSDDEHPGLRSYTSRESVGRQQEGASLRPDGNRRRRPSSVPRTPRRSPLRDGRSRSPLSTRGLVHRLEPSASVEVLPAPENRSPLTKLFASRSTPASAQELHGTDAAVRRVEGLLEEIRDLPVRRLKDEMRELQDRQARIENLLLMLTRGMRNETGHGTHRHDTIS